MKKIFLIILFQQILFAQAKDPQYIAVEGKATVKVPVEYFLIRITIKNEGQTLSEANKQNKINVLKMFDVLKKHSISDSDFVTKSSETSEASLPSFPFVPSLPAGPVRPIGPSFTHEVAAKMTSVAQSKSRVTLLSFIK